MRVFFALVIIALSATPVYADNFWVNNITVGENNATWEYTETFTGMDAMMYRINIDTGLGNNDSFINSWELLKADRDIRKRLRSSIDSELDVRVNNLTSGIEIVDIDATLSPDAIGNTHTADSIINRYSVSYGFEDSILNASSIWFLGQPLSPVTIIMPGGVDITNITGMDNVTSKKMNHTEISGYFAEKSQERGEITLSFVRNESFVEPEVNVTDVRTPEVNVTKPMTGTLKEMLSKIRYISLGFVGVIIIILIYVFVVRKK